MGKDSGIEWTDHSFNPWWGCTKVSAGCHYCYAEAMAVRIGKDCFGKDKTRILMSDEYWAAPLKWDQAALRQAQGPGGGRKPRVFCGSMCDVFDMEAPMTEREKLRRLIEQTPNLQWMLLTKRPENVWILGPSSWIPSQRDHTKPKTWPSNVALGVTVERQKEVWRASKLRDIAIRYGVTETFVSVEPMLEKIYLPYIERIDMVICGCESGPKRREFREEWARNLRDQCVEAGTPFFYKQGIQDGRVVKMPELDGKVWAEMPIEYPF